MSYRWYYSEDLGNLEEVRKVEKNLLLFPSLGEIRKELRKGRPFSVFHSTEPPEDFPIFVEVYIPPKYAPYTEAEWKIIQALEEKEEKDKVKAQILERKLKLKIHYPKLSFKNLVGAGKLKETLSLVKRSFEVELPPGCSYKGVFLVGIPGVGKSYSAKCFAGEMGWALVEMNISRILEEEKPLSLLKRIFVNIERLSLRGEEKGIVLWIDEIDKVFTEGERERKLMGQLLTILEELNSPVGYKFKGLVWATANDVSIIVERNPEFFERFDILFFIDLPSFKDAPSIISYYLNLYRVKPPEGYDEITVASFIKNASEKYKEVPQDRFPYVPREINKMLRELSIRARIMGRDCFTLEELEEFLNRVPPLVVRYDKAIQNMREQKSYFIVV